MRTPPERDLALSAGNGGAMARRRAMVASLAALAAGLLAAAGGAMPVGAAPTPAGLPGAPPPGPVAEVYVADADSGTISQFGVDKHGVVTPLPVPAVAVGGNPAHVLLSPNGKYLYALDCVAGVVLQFTVGTKAVNRGQLLPQTPPSVPAGPCVQDRLSGPERVLAETHSGKFFFALEQGASDVVLHEFAVSSTGALSSVAAVATGLQGGATLLITPNGKYLYALDPTGNLTVYGVDIHGVMSVLQAAHPFVTCPSDAVIMHSGKAMYIVEPCRSMLSTLRINPDGTLTLLGLNGHGCPTQVVVTPNNKNVYVADPCTGPVIFQYRAFPDGVLTEDIPFSVPSGHVLAMATATNGKSLYVTLDNGTQNLAAYPIDEHGLLVPTPATVGTGLGSWGIAVRK